MCEAHIVWRHQRVVALDDDIESWLLSRLGASLSRGALPYMLWELMHVRRSDAMIADHRG
jgi:hypothetical protein